jgi:ribonuclease P protein component
VHSFSKEKRLLTKQAFDNVFLKPNKIQKACFSILYRKNRYALARLGCIIAKKKVKKAHDRHRIRRIIKESFRQMSSIDCYDVIVIAKDGVNAYDNKSLFQQLSEVWHQLEKYHPSCV